MEHLQRAGAIPRQRQQTLPAHTGGLDTNQHGQRRQTGSLEHSEEITHDRTGTPAHPIPHHNGTGTAGDTNPARHHAGSSASNPTGVAEYADNTSHNPGKSTTHPDPTVYTPEQPGHHPAQAGTTDLQPCGTATRTRTALTTLERVVHELGRLVGKVEQLVARQVEKKRELEREQVQTPRRGMGLGR